MLAATTALVLACLPFQGRELDNFRPVPGAATAPLGSLERVADSGAFVMDDRPAEFDALVLWFVNALVRPGASSSRD